MSSNILQLLILAGIAIFLILRLRDVLGRRDGFEQPPQPKQQTELHQPAARQKPDLQVIEGGPDYDIIDYVPEGSAEAGALAKMKSTEPGFSVGEFISGARQAYEWILMAFEKGDIDEIETFLSADVFQAFADVIEERKAQGYEIEAEFFGVRDVKLKNATFDSDSREARLSVAFEAEMSSVVRNREGEIVEGTPDEIQKQRDVWTFSRKMGADDPNWILVETGA